MPDADFPRLIEYAFPLEQTSLDSVHEKNVRHGHISTLHIWPARRPLAACRAALIATLLPDPGTPEKRRELCEKIAGKVVKRIEKKKMPGGQVVEREKKETEGGILHWGRETENAETLEWFRQEIRKAYGGRAPKVLDPFAGGGAIPLEAMRLGCEATAIDINPVAWFILKCTLEYPQKLAGQKRPLPAFILKNRTFMEGFFKAQGLGKAQIRQELEKLGHADEAAHLKGLSYEAPGVEADLAWHVRAWGQWVLDHARKDLAPFYPVYADFEPLDKDKKSYERQPMQLVPLKDDGTADIDALNKDFTPEYLGDKRNPRWVAKPTVAYLWARTVTCKNCRATIPLLKTRWLCRKENKRILLAMEPNANKTGVVFGIEADVPVKGGNAAQRREHDRRIGAGTMSRAGTTCPCCGLPTMTMEDIKLEGQAKRLQKIPTAVVVEGQSSREFRLPTCHEETLEAAAAANLDSVFHEVPYGKPQERIVEDAKRNTWCVQYGIDEFQKLFTSRQLVALATFVRVIREVREQTIGAGYQDIWSEAIVCFLASGLDRLADRCSTVCRPDPSPKQSGVINTFSRFALPVTWDFIEGVPLEASSGGYVHCLEWIALCMDNIAPLQHRPAPRALRGTATQPISGIFDVICTDPPYYNAIGYSVLMDFFHVWLRRQLAGMSVDFDRSFDAPLGPKWDQEAADGELVDDASRHGWNALKSKDVYESGMATVFKNACTMLSEGGRFVVVFAHKEPDAWETLVTAIIRAGFVVDASWPIQTEMGNRTRALSSAALASSVWLVCKKRPATVRPGWDNKVLDEMRAKIGQRLRDFWDAGIRGPDFVWAATGPALEAYSQHPVVKKANDPGQVMTVSEFLTHVRRMVVDFVVGRVLGGDGEADAEPSVDRLDEPTAYYLLHRHDFGLDDAPVGACILYATACGLSDQELMRDWDLLIKTGGDGSADEEDETEDAEAEPAEEAGSGSKVKLKAWNARHGRSMGVEAPGGRPVPIIDRIHRLMQLWKAGDVHKVDEYFDEHGLRRHELFRRVLQAVTELSQARSDERSLLESLCNQIGLKGAKRREPQRVFPQMVVAGESEDE